MITDRKMIRKFLLENRDENGFVDFDVFKEKTGMENMRMVACTAGMSDVVFTFECDGFSWHMIDHLGDIDVVVFD